MSKPVKDLMTSEIRTQSEGIDSVCVIAISGLDATNPHLMRGELTKQTITIQYVQTSVPGRAVAGRRADEERAVLRLPHSVF